MIMVLHHRIVNIAGSNTRVGVKTFVWEIFRVRIQFARITYFNVFVFSFHVADNIFCNQGTNGEPTVNVDNDFGGGTICGGGGIVQIGFYISEIGGTHNKSRRH